MSRIFFIADTHFYHENIIKYCDRPFKDAIEMNEVLINNWNNIVQKDDIVYHLGDLTLINNQVSSLVNSLNGKIYLLRGNHDGKSVKFYNERGLEVIPSKMILEEYKIVLSHRPLNDSEIPKGYINVHGHIHNSVLDDDFSVHKHICVSVEMIDYTPIEINELLKKITRI